MKIAALLLICLPLAAQFDDIAAKAAKARDADQLDQAVSLYRQAVHLHPAWAEGWWYLGTIAYDRQRFAEAAACLNKVAALAPKDAKAFAMLGLSETQLKQNRAALNHLERALALDVGDENNMRQVVLFTQATLLISEGAFGRAQDALDKLSIERPSADEELRLALGRAVIGILPSDAALALETRDLLMTAGQAEFLDANRKTAEATQAYADLAKRFPKTHNVQFAYGRFLLKNHLDEQAVAAFKREIENNPQHLLARLGIAGGLLSTEPATGLPYAEQAVQLAPKLEEAHYLYGACLLEAEQTTHAITELETARRLNPKDERVYFRLAKAYAITHRETDAAEARETFRQLRQASGDEPKKNEQ